MAAAFDAYHRWLSIPPEEQPPHHYRLLSLKLFESDPDVIESAADRQMTHVRGFQSGQHAEASQRILNEIAAAQAEIADPQTAAEQEAAADAWWEAADAQKDDAVKQLCRARSGE